MHRYLLGVFGISAFVLAACGGSGTNVFIPPPTPPPTPVPQSNVSFLLIVPSAAASTTRRPNVTLPSSAQSARITLDSVNGTAQTGTPVVVNLSGSTSGCQQTSSQLVCVVDVSVAPGTDVFTLQVYSAANAGGSLIAEGNVSVATSPGQTTTAPATLSGTISKIVLAVGPGELGNAASVPVTVMAEDSNGDTILGSYNTPVTLMDTDASGQTSLSSTSVPDSTTAAGVTLNYLGGAMAQAATLGASASGVSSGNVTGTTFSPDATNPTVNGNQVEFSETYAYGYAENALPASTPDGGSYTYGFTYTSGQTYNGVANAIDEDGSYYAWVPEGSSLVLGYLGNGSDYTCASPYYEEFVLPLPTSWNAYQGAGACTYSESENNGPTDFYNETETYNADGSFSESGSYNDTYCCTNDFGSYNESIDSAGDVNFVNSEGGGSYALSAPAPSGGATVTATYNLFPSGTFPPSATPTPTVTAAPNPYVAIGVAALAGKPLSPLQSDIYTVKGPVASLPVACNVSATILGTNPTITEIDEAYNATNPGGFDEGLYETENNQYYYLAGVGEVCYVDAYTEYYFDEDAIEWYDGADQNWDSCIGINTDYLTSTTLTATAGRSRNVTQSSPPSAALLAAAIQSERHKLEKARQARILARKKARFGTSFRPGGL